LDHARILQAIDAEPGPVVMAALPMSMTPLLLLARAPPTEKLEPPEPFVKSSLIWPLLVRALLVKKRLPFSISTAPLIAARLPWPNRRSGH